MKGHDALIAMRKEGRQPRGVWICHAIDNTRGWATWQKYAGFDRYPEIEILPTESPELLDLRFVVGLTVHVGGMKVYAKAKRLHKALVDAKAKRVITVCGGLIIDSEFGEWDGYVPE